MLMEAVNCANSFFYRSRCSLRGVDGAGVRANGVDCCLTLL
jgi:hypothetical protein